jgi:RNA polymerase sigma-70 factor (ECF subfamily)
MPSLPDTRASLIVRLPDADDRTAWDEFAQVYAPLVYRLARRQGLQPADADDVVQEVLSAVARSVDAWLARSDRGPFRAWLLRIARNTALNLLTRRLHQTVGAGGSDVARRLAQHAEPETDTTDELDWEYRRQVFRWAADRVRSVVTSTTWRAFWLSSVEQFSAEEAAGELEISVASVYIARSRVLARLRKLVQQFEEAHS